MGSHLWLVNLRKLGFEETVQRGIDSLEGGEDEDCDAERPECLSGAQSGVR